MRKNEKAKITIQKKYAFARKEKREDLRLPKGYEDQESDNYKKLMTHGVIYEVKLLDWIERVDIEADGNFIKTIKQKSPRNEWENPRDFDEIKLNLKVYQGLNVFLERGEWETTMKNEEIPLTLFKILESLKRGESSTVAVKPSFIVENDQKYLEQLGDRFDQNQDLQIDVELLNLIKVEEWYKGETSTYKRILRKGKGKSP